ncbi:sulfatase-like hydrolase/transferase [Hoeflea sp.]|uniref:sulfatase-like hydrolase/transferase n=1 Tax=Hoeflea sp. TaxID=1940281 RepID=UPI00374A1292
MIEKGLRTIFTPAAVTAAGLLCTAFLYMTERAVEHMPFVLLSTSGLAALLFLLSRRIYFSIYAALGLTVLLTTASVIKYRSKGFDLHIYDFVFTGTDTSAFTFLFSEFTLLIAPIIAVLLCGILLLGLVFAIDAKSSLPVKWRLGLAAAVMTLIPATYPLQADEPRYFHYLSGFNASSFFVSLLDLKDATLGEDAASRFANRSPEDPFPPAAPCSSDISKPDIFIVLSESQIELAGIDRHGISQRFPSSQRSGDGKRRGLRVETFGGGTWISNFSLMTGLSSLEFGWQAPYLTTILENRVHRSLATELADCGYRTAALMPMQHNFVNEGPFLESIGFEHILDYDQIGASQYAHEDRFYFEAARAFIEEHRANDGRPLFLQVQTMFAHSPYTDSLATPLSGEGINSGDPELDEYVQRVAQSQADFGWFLTQSEAEKTTHPSIVLEFGDHQSFATKQMLSDTDPDFALNDLRSRAYETYFTVHGFGVDLDMTPFNTDELDIGFLGVSLLDAAGLDKSPMFADLSALRDRCEGQLYFCSDREAVEAHIGRRLASGDLVLQ